MRPCGVIGTLGGDEGKWTCEKPAGHLGFHVFTRRDSDSWNELVAEVQAVDHPAHYGGADDPYECIKVIEAWKLGFNLGNALKYISRAGKKPGVPAAEDLRKAIWYLQREAGR